MPITYQLTCGLLLLALLLPGPALAEPAGSRGVHVYSTIPGIVPSTRFSARVHDGKAWLPLFTMETVGPQKTETGIYAQGIYETVAGHSSSWCTFEMDVPVMVEVTKLSPGDIESCVIRPLSRGLQPVISEDKRSIRFAIDPRFAEQTTTASNQVPVNVAIEINGQTQEMMTVFASPYLAEKPQPDDLGVLQVQPGQAPPVEGDWHTLYFMPGVHDLGKQAYPLRPGKTYYIPGDAWVDGGFGDGPDNIAEGARLFGLGVISGRKLGWREVDQGKAAKLLHLFGPDAVVEGLTFINSAHHTWMGGSDDPGRPTIYRNVKCHNWRVNTDGLHFFGSGIAEDVFFHGQDDGHYIASRSDRVRFRRWVFWRDDAFGVDIIFTAGGGQITPADAIAEDSDSIYNHSTWNGNIIDQRNLKKGEWVDGITIRDLRVENPGANKPVVNMYLPRHSCSFKNVLLKNITVHADNGHPFRITGGGPDSIIENVTFEDIRMGDRWIEDFSLDNFTLAFVKNLKIVRDGETVATYSSDIAEEARQIRPDPENLLDNPGFEISGYGWNGRQITKADVPVREGSFASRSTDLPGRVNSVRQRITPEVKKRGGGRYRVTAWIWIDEGKGTGDITIQLGQANRDNGAREVVEFTTERTPLKAGEWVEVSGELTANWDRENYPWLRWANFSATGRGQFKGLAFDDCRLEYLGEQ